jgi:DNA-directed RNA polymerase specialized sigma24 family protein
VSDAEIYRKYADELVRFATVLVGPDAAADVVSASVITAFRAPAWSGVRNPRAYLYQAVLNESRMTARRDARRLRYEQRAAPRDTCSAWAAAPGRNAAMKPLILEWRSRPWPHSLDSRAAS